eukprot:NODE_124_length_17341_cov_0.560028.p4 type:complete len:527 gc:universal NODE_124_length_17341_cov_0.560028:13270-14850(+)
MSQQNYYNQGYQRPNQQSPQQPQQNAQSPQMQNNSPQMAPNMYQQHMMMNQMRMNPQMNQQMMYQYMRGQMPMQSIPQNINPQMIAAQIQQNTPTIHQPMPPSNPPPMNPQMNQQMQQQMQQQRLSAQYSNYQQYTARMPHQIQQYQMPYKKSTPSFNRNPTTSQTATPPKPLQLMSETKKLFVPPPKPNNPPTHIPSAKQVGIKLLQPIKNDDSAMIHKKTKDQASRLLKDELRILFRTMDRKRAFFQFVKEFDETIAKRTSNLQRYYDNQKLAVAKQFDKHSTIGKIMAIHHARSNISTIKIIKDTKNIGYKIGDVDIVEKEYFQKKKNARVMPCRWVGLHERANYGRRVRLPAVSVFDKHKFPATSRLQSLAPIRLNIDMDGLAIADTFTWDVSNNSNTFSFNVTPEIFAYILAEDFKYPLHKDFIDKIIEQISNGLEDYMICPYTGVSSYFSKDEDDINEDEKVKSNDLRIVIKINVTIGFVRLDDEFEWDIFNLDNSPEEFAEVLCSELHLGGEFMYNFLI